MLSERDQKVLWHPYTQMQLADPPIGIVRGEGAYLFDEHGNKYIDAISSWWTNIHGHAHPYIVKKVSEQLAKLDHVLFAGFTHEPAVKLAEELLKILPSNQQRIFYSDNGSTAVEVAMKMALQYWSNRGEKRTKIIALENAYHGDTFGAMSASGRSIFTEPFNDLLFEVIHVSLSQLTDGGRGWTNLKDVAAFIYEPLVQGTAGMVMYDAEILEQMLVACKQHGIITIADEVMTGFGRTGKLFASDYLTAQPDIICLSKGITGGVMALGATSCTAEIYNAFLSSDKTKTFFHGHSYTANPIACSAAVASMELLLQKQTQDNIQRISNSHKEFLQKLKSEKIKSAASLGTILAIEFNTENETGYLNTIRDQLYRFFIDRKIILRPLGNIIYTMPPYCISDADLKTVYAAMEEAINIFTKEVA